MNFEICEQLGGIACGTDLAPYTRHFLALVSVSTCLWLSLCKTTEKRITKLIRGAQSAHLSCHYFSFDLLDLLFDLLLQRTFSTLFFEFDGANIELIFLAVYAFCPSQIGNWLSKAVFRSIFDWGICISSPFLLRFMVFLRVQHGFCRPARKP